MSLMWADILVSYALFVMQNYFTDVWKLSLTHAATILNIWNGIYRILPLFFLCLVDSFLGHFKLLVFTTISYSAGMVFVFMSLPPILANSAHTCKGYEPRCIARAEEGLLYVGLALIAVGVAGNLVSIKPFLNKQSQLISLTRDGVHYQVSGLIGAVIVGVFGKTIPYIRPWTLRFGIPAVCTVLATLWFLSGSCSYKKSPPNPNGSPLCTACRVFVSAAFKMFRPYPDDIQQYNGINDVHFSTTSCLRALHKAAIIEENGASNGWKLCSTKEVEDAKTIVRLLPMWMTFVVCGIISSTGDTYFVEQAGKLDRHIGKLKLPVEVLLLARSWLSYLFSIIEDFLESYGKNNVPLFGMILAMVCSVLCCISAAGTERMRLHIVRRNGLLDNPDEHIPMSMYWLLFQFVLLGGLDSILLESANAYYIGKCHESMRAYLKSFSHAVFGLGFMCSSLSVYAVGRIRERGGMPNWFQETLNRSRLDRYYWFLAALGSVNLVVFVVIAAYRYKNPVVEELDADSSYNG